MNFVKTIIFIFIFSFTALIIKAENDPNNIIEKESINWSTIKIYQPELNKNKIIPYFENGVIENNSYPLFSKKIGLQNQNSQLAEIKFLQLYFEPVTEGEKQLFDCYTNISDSIPVQFCYKTEQKHKYLHYSFIPVRKNKKTGKLERVRYFVLEIRLINPIGINYFKNQYPSESVLNTGDWFKFSVDKSGVYQIFYSDLVSMGLSDPQNVRIYGNGGAMLPEINSGDKNTDLKEIPVQFYKGADGIFNEGDYLIFYAQGPSIWKWNVAQNSFDHEINRFTDKIQYFITSNAGGKTISSMQPPSLPSNTNVNSFDYLAFHESDYYNLIRSGREFYGEKFGTQLTYSFPFEIPNPVLSEKIKFESRVLARSKNTTSFQFLNNNQGIGTVPVSNVNINSDLSNYANVGILTTDFTASSGALNINVVFNKNGDESALGWLDYICFNARANLVYSNSQLEFRDIKSVGADNIASFTISSTNSGLLVWDISDINNTQQMTTTYQNSQYTFIANSETLRNYIIFDPKNNLLKPQFETESKIPNQNLHGIKNKQFIIVSHPDFLTQANELATLHETIDGIASEVVTTDQVYNEFSSGNQDPAAIRNFMKMLYDNAGNGGDLPKYLLLFGDGSYDNKLQSTTNTNYIVTFESSNSLSPVDSYVSDDYFGILDDNEHIETGSMDIGVGRLPVSSADEAEAVVNKIKKYTDKSSLGNWRNQICFIGDDEDNNIHMQQADQLASIVNQNFPSFNTNKIYLDAYQQISTSSGERYPDVNTAIYNQLNSGALIMNYTGHGNENGLAHEQIVRHNEDVNQWQNKMYPLFVTATCEFSRFDDYNYQTAGEDVLLNPNGGGIALLTTTRLVYSGPNFVLNQQFYNHVFSSDSNGDPLPLGEIMRRTKNGAGNDINKLNFTLLGDPALKLNIPKFIVKTDSINGGATSIVDTIKAYQEVTVKGHVENGSGSLLSNFNGTINMEVFDKNQTISTLGNDNNPVFTFSLQNKTIFKGKATVKNGTFAVTFVVPRDIDYNYGLGKVSYYADNAQTDASGYFADIAIGGVSETASTDKTGPSVALYLNDTLFRNGGIANEYPVLLALVNDESGINPGGNSIGHDIIACIDDNPAQTYILNSYFQNDLDNFTSGKVIYQLPQITPGKHNISFKIWDIFNNSSLVKLAFEVKDGSNLAINHAYNYPNPFYDHTNFFFEHNSDLGNISATIEIYNMTGKKIKSLFTDVPAGGFTSGPIYWDGYDEEGKKILPGIYIYQIILRSNSGWVKSKSQKLIVID